VPYDTRRVDTNFVGNGWEFEKPSESRKAFNCLTQKKGKTFREIKSNDSIYVWYKEGLERPLPCGKEKMAVFLMISYQKWRKASKQVVTVYDGRRDGAMQTL
jgi:hypothetical protein